MTKVSTSVKTPSELQDQTHRPLSLRLLGSPAICLDEQPLGAPLGGKAQALLYYLAVTGRAHSRPALAGLLWGDMPEEMARTNLRKALADLRPLAGDYLNIEYQTVSFRTDRTVWVDVAEFAAKASQGSTREETALLQEAVDLYGGDFLEGFYVRNAADFEAWVLIERARHRELALQALTILTTLHAQQGDLAQAIEATRRLLALEPWREEAHYQLMQLLAQSGQRSTALAQYEICRRILDDELDVEPGAETTALYQQIRTGQVETMTRWQDNKMTPSSPHPVILSSPHPATPASNLPEPPTPLVDRAAELEWLGELLGNRECRLLTITGPGGVGKTRLAIEAARRILDFGFWILDLERPSPTGNPKSKIQNSPMVFSLLRWPRSVHRPTSPRPLPVRWALLSTASRMCRPSCSTIYAKNRCCWCWTIWSICWPMQPR